MAKSLVVAAAVLAFAVALALHFNVLILDEGVCEASQRHIWNATEPTFCFFSERYFHARSQFRTLATMAGGTLHQIDIGTDNLTIDIAVFRSKNASSSSNAVIHLSGVHGVEGHAGSAVQLAILRDLIQNRTILRDDGPTVILVHLVNPFGFMHGRRMNEGNVDLNRNNLHHDAQWSAVLARHPDFVGYETLRPFLLPDHALSTWEVALHYLKAVPLLLTHGFSTLKRTLVTGQYHDPAGPYYGGRAPEPSRARLWAWFEAQNLTTWADLVQIDVHTGLGPAGMDSLLFDAVPSLPGDYERVFNGAFALEGLRADTSGDVLDGYADTVGFTSESCDHFFKGSPTLRSVCLTQEFGTMPGIMVAMALVRENAAFQYGTEAERIEASEALRNVFYVKSATWKREIATRGLRVFQQALAIFQT